MFLLAILTPACVSSSPAFLMMYSAYKLNKQGDNIQPDVPLFLFGTSLLFHVQFYLRQVRWSGIPIYFRTSAEMGLISPGRENLLDFLEVRQVLSTYNGDLRDPFLPRSRCLLLSWMQSASAVILEPKKIKMVTVPSYSPSICHKVMEPDAMILVF